MKKLSGISMIFCLWSLLCSPVSAENPNPDAFLAGSPYESLYQELNLQGRLSRKAWQYAMQGFLHLRSEDFVLKKSLLTIIDFTRPSTAKRLFIIDVEQGRLLYNTLVAHGKNSGLLYATDFSNTPESRKSSVGFHLTQATYHGGHGYSLKLRGLEPRINDNAEKRRIVVHGADYVSRDFVQRHRRLGRSWGCPALPKRLSKKIIDLVKDGSCVFIFGGDEHRYLRESTVLRRQVGNSPVLLGR